MGERWRAGFFAVPPLYCKDPHDRLRVLECVHGRACDRLSSTRPPTRTPVRHHVPANALTGSPRPPPKPDPARLRARSVFKSMSETEMRNRPSTESHCQCHRKNPCVTANGNPSRMSAPLTGGRRRSTAGLLACGSSSLPGLPGFPVAIDWARTRRLQLRGQPRSWFPIPFPGPRNRTVFPLSPRLRGTVGYTYTFG